VSKQRQAVGLFLSEAEIARLLKQDPKDWPSIALILERNGFPRVDPIMGCRYWPACESYFDRQYGLTNVEVSQPDQGEDLEALK
jgi:hypothetical protein